MFYPVILPYESNSLLVFAIRQKQDWLPHNPNIVCLALRKARKRDIKNAKCKMHSCKSRGGRSFIDASGHILGNVAFTSTFSWTVISVR